MTDDYDECEDTLNNIRDRLMEALGYSMSYRPGEYPQHKLVLPDGREIIGDRWYLERQCDPERLLEELIERQPDQGGAT